MSEPGEWSFVAVHDVVAAAAPDRDMVVCGPVRRTFGEVAERTRSLAAFLRGRGVGLHTDRAELERWESGQDPVALVLHNGTEYIEAMIGAFRARAVPFNVNQHYRPSEVQALLADVGVKAIVYHRRYRPLVETALAGHGGHRADRRRRRFGHGAAARQHPLRGGGAHAGHRAPARRRRPTISIWCARAGRRDGPRPCCGARPTSMSRPWPVWRGPRPSRSPRR